VSGLHLDTTWQGVGETRGCPVRTTAPVAEPTFSLCERYFVSNRRYVVRNRLAPIALYRMGTCSVACSGLFNGQKDFQISFSSEQYCDGFGGK
jgi:hypothetical protein